MVDGKQQNFPKQQLFGMWCLFEMLGYMSCLGCSRPLYPLFSPQACYQKIIF